MTDHGTGGPADRPEPSRDDRSAPGLGLTDPADKTENSEAENDEARDAEAPRRAPDHWASEILD